MELPFLLLLSFIVGILIYRLVLPDFFKQYKLWRNIIVSTATGFTAIFISIVVGPLILVPSAYFAGLALHFLGGKNLRRIKIWKTIFAFSTVVCFSWAFLYCLFNFLYHGGKARQSEAKTLLANITAAEISYFIEHKTYSNRFDELGWEADNNKKYSFFLSSNIEDQKSHYQRKNKSLLSFSLFGIDTEVFNNAWKVDSRREKEALYKFAKIHGIGVTADNFSAIAIGNIDQDPTLDVWIINKKKEPTGLQNDVNLGVGGPSYHGVPFVAVYIGGAVTPFTHIVLVLLLFFFNLGIWITLMFLDKSRVSLTKTV